MQDAAFLLLFEMCLYVSCVLGDFLTFAQASILKRATLDSLTHGIIAFTSWLVVRYDEFPSVLHEAVLCMFISMAVDLDHFLAAQSFKLRDALSLPKRPPFHNTTLMLMLTLGIIVAQLTVWKVNSSVLTENSAEPTINAFTESFQHSDSVFECTLILLRSFVTKFVKTMFRTSTEIYFAVLFVVAWFSHHMRDANRRGIWLSPWGSTPPIPYAMYVTILVAFPLVARFIMTFIVYFFKGNRLCSEPVHIV